MAYHRIDFTFSGFVQDAEIKKVYDDKGKIVNLKDVSAEELADNLASGYWFLDSAEQCPICKGECHLTVLDCPSNCLLVLRECLCCFRQLRESYSLAETRQDVINKIRKQAGLEQRT